MIDRDKLVEVITQQVLAALSGQAAATTDLTHVDSVVASGATRISYCGNGADAPTGLGSSIDHTLLRADATAADIDHLCDEAAEYRFAAVCINPVWVRRAAARLRGSGVAVASVVGFPLGAAAPEIKAMECRRALRDGAREIDMVINIGALKGGGPRSRSKRHRRRQRRLS